jgi:Ca-activated chloride channel family protein
MSFASPWWLLALLAIPLLAAAAANRSRADRYAIRFPAASSLAEAATAARSRLHFLPPVLLVLALTALGLALARPEREVKVPIAGATVVLVTDHSGSMAATDVEPTRLEAATKAAISFLEATPDSARVGLVTYSDGPDQAIQPTRNHDVIRAGLENQTANGATATGDALQVALDMVRRQRSTGKRPPSAIVLLSDGQRTAGINELDVAQEAQRLKVPISTVSLGTQGATIPNPNNPSFPAIPVPPDPETLAEIASITGGRAFSAGDADKLTSIYESLGSSLATKTEKREITEQFAAAGLLLLLAAGLASAGLAGRVP